MAAHARGAPPLAGRALAGAARHLCGMAVTAAALAPGAEPPTHPPTHPPRVPRAAGSCWVPQPVCLRRRHSGVWLGRRQHGAQRGAAQAHLAGVAPAGGGGPCQVCVCECVCAWGGHAAHVCLRSRRQPLKGHGGCFSTPAACHDCRRQASCSCLAGGRPLPPLAQAPLPSSQQMAAAHHPAQSAVRGARTPPTRQLAHVSRAPGPPDARGCARAVRGCGGADAATLAVHMCVRVCAVQCRASAATARLPPSPA